MSLINLLSGIKNRFIEERADPSNLRITDVLPIFGTPKYLTRVAAYLATSQKNQSVSFSVRNCLKMLIYDRGVARKIATDLALLRVFQFEIGTLTGYCIYEQITKAF